LRQQAARLEVKRNFFSNRVVEEWNKKGQLSDQFQEQIQRTQSGHSDTHLNCENGAGEETPVWTTSGPRHSLKGLYLGHWESSYK
jgi:hypothetical protein